MNRIVALLVLLFLLGGLLLLTGCGSASTSSPAVTVTVTAAASSSTASETPAPQVSGAAAIKFVDAGFTEDKSSGTPAVGYGLVLQNTSPGQDATDVQVTVNFLDPSGTIVQTDSQTVTVIPANSRFYLGGECFPSAHDQLSTVKAIIVPGGWQNASAKLPEITNVRIESSDLGPEVRGVVHNTTSATLSGGAQIGMVLFNAAGKVVGGGWTNLGNDLPAGASAAFASGSNGVDDCSHAAISSAKVSVDGSFN
jgi:hypothetical protein